MPSVFDRLRTLLERAVAGNGHVSDRPGNYFFDEDTAAFAEIFVSGPSGDVEPRIAIISAYAEPKRSFAVRIWRRYAREVWIVDCERQQIEQVADDIPLHAMCPGNVLSSSAVPGLTIAVSEIFK